MAKESKMKKFFGEFKTFITRGNVLDLAVGVIIGGAFTAIVTALSDNILKPIINWILALILGGDSLSEVYTMLKEYRDPVTQVVDLTQSIYIDWGAFINAIINFILIALVLFCIVRAINRFAAARDKMRADYETERLAIQKYRKEGMTKAQAIEKYNADLAAAKAAEEEAARLKAAEEAAKAAEEARLAEEKAMANTRLLEEIRDLLKNK